MILKENKKKKSVPAKVMAGHVVELFVKWLVEVSQSLNHIRMDVRVRAAFSFAEAVRFAVALGSFEAGEALGGVKVKVFVRDLPPQAQEVLYAGHLPGRVADQTLPAHKQQLAHGEKLQPLLQMPGVHADLHRAPRGVYYIGCDVFKSQALEGRDVGFL